MAALISFFIILFLSLTIVRVATAMLKMTGLSEDMAQFQARSAFTGTGFTSRESESVINHPVRRKIIQNLMLMGSIGIVTFISSLLLTFTAEGSNQDLYLRFGMLLGGALLIFLLSRTRLFNWLLSKMIEKPLKKWSRIYAKDYDSLLFLSGEWEIIKIKVGEDSWLRDKQLMQVRLSEEGILVISIRRSDGYFIGSPRGDSVIFCDDELILYGREKALRELGNRKTGITGDEAHQNNIRKTREQEGRPIEEKPVRKWISKLKPQKKKPSSDH